MNLLRYGPLTAVGVFAVCALGFALAGSTLGGCCTTAKCLDRHSSPDRSRVHAKEAKLGVVHNDRVSSPDRDRTDWRYIDLPKPGKLIVQLHWDTGRSQLELAVFDVLGVKIQGGRPWGSGGRRAIIAIEDPGRYYIRVRGVGKRDESNYALRLMFKPDRPDVPCQACKPGERKCLGDESFVICKKVTEDCNTWGKPTPCASGTPCREGTCVGCQNECAANSRRCGPGGTVEVCQANGSGCLAWVPRAPCRKGLHCTGGKCVRVKRHVKPPPRPPVPKKSVVRAKIISIYRYRGRMTLHLEIGDNSEVKAGQIGHVMDASTRKRLPGGEVKVSRVAGRYAIATTNLEKLGKNRWVEIRVR